MWLLDAVICCQHYERILNQLEWLQLEWRKTILFKTFFILYNPGQSKDGSLLSVAQQWFKYRMFSTSQGLHLGENNKNKKDKNHKNTLLKNIVSHLCFSQCNPVNMKPSGILNICSCVPAETINHRSQDTLYHDS